MMYGYRHVRRRTGEKSREEERAGSATVVDSLITCLGAHDVSVESIRRAASSEHSIYKNPGQSKRE